KRYRSPRAQREERAQRRFWSADACDHVSRLAQAAGTRGPGRDGPTRAAPRTDPGVQISRTGLPPTGLRAFESLHWPRVTDAGRWEQEASFEAAALFVAPLRTLAPSLQRSMPGALQLVAKALERAGVRGHAVVLHVAANHAAQPAVLHVDGMMSASP